MLFEGLARGRAIEDVGKQDEGEVEREARAIIYPAAGDHVAGTLPKTN